MPPPPLGLRRSDCNSTLVPISVLTSRGDLRVKKFLSTDPHIACTIHGLMMACHPSGIVVDVVGILASNNGRSCEEHDCCGKEIIAKDVVVRFRVVQLEREVVNEANPEPEATAIAVYHVTDGIDGC